MGPFAPPMLPPATAEYVSTVHPSQPGGSPRQTAYRLFRSSDGKTRVDSGNTSVITDPPAGKTIVLDHLKKQAQIVPLAPQPAAPGMPAMPSVPGLPGAPATPPIHTQDLGKAFLQGQEAEGKRYTIQPPAMPPPPALPGMPKIPVAPPPPPPTTAEVWTSTRLQLPLASRISGSFGQQTSICQNAISGEPNPAVFQVPSDYKQVLPQAPKLPGR